MDNFTYSNPTKIIFGRDTISKIGEEISKLNINRVLMLSGGGSIKTNGVYEEFKSSMNKSGIEFIEHWGVCPNPILQHAEQALKIIKENDLQAIVAIGGGSVIDEAKAVSAGYFANSIWDLYEKKEIPQKALPLFTILTISGTGSEMNGASVLTNGDKKWALISPYIFPKVSIIDPSKQAALSKELTVYGGIDAMTHIFENYFASEHLSVTLSYNEALLKTIMKSIDKLLIQPDDYNSRADLAWSATMALNGYASIGIRSGDWSSHKIEHAISAFYPKVAHGAGLSIVYPAWISYIHKFTDLPSFNQWANNIWNTSSIDEAVNKMKQKFSSWGSPVSLSEIGIKENEFEALAENALASGPVGNIKRLTKEDIINILKIAK